MRWLWVTLVVAGCYHPEPAPGAPCSDSKLCPSGLLCRNGLCIDENTPWDAATVGMDTRMVDARMVDATPDALDPAIGCADGTREAFADRTAYPTIAGCAATWSGTKDLRAAKTGTGCGNAVECTQPADACAPGWHICATNGDPADLTTRINAASCHVAGGATGTYVAATQHCTSLTSMCNYNPPYPCDQSGTCTEPVCCGSTCVNTQGCKGGVFPDPDTWIANSALMGCGAFPGGSVTGVMCCQ